MPQAVSRRRAHDLTSLIHPDKANTWELESGIAARSTVGLTIRLVARDECYVHNDYNVLTGFAVVSKRAFAPVKKLQCLLNDLNPGIGTGKDRLYLCAGQSY